MKNKTISILAISILILGFSLHSVPISTAFAEGDNQDSSNHEQKSFGSDNSTNGNSKDEHPFSGNAQFNQEKNQTKLENQNESENKTVINDTEENKTMSEHQGENKTVGKSEGEMNGHHQGETDTPEELQNQNRNENATHHATEQDVSHIEDAKTNQTIAAEVQIGDGNINQKSIDNNVVVKTENTTNDAVNITVSATNQTGPKVILVNLNSTTIDVSSIKYLHVLYDGHPISPAANVDQILHANSTDESHYAILVTQNGAQILISIPHFSTHTITLSNISKVIPVIPEFGPLVGIIVSISVIGSLVISRKFSKV